MTQVFNGVNTDSHSSVEKNNEGLRLILLIQMIIIASNQFVRSSPTSFNPDII